MRDSGTFCMTVSDYTGMAVEFDGSGWSDPIVVDPNGQFGRRGVSCQSNTFCVVGDTDGNVVVYRHGQWQAPFSLGEGTDHGVEALSCPTSRFCLAVDDDAIGYTYHVTHWTKGVFLGGSFAVPKGASCGSRHHCVAVSLLGIYETFSRGHRLQGLMNP